MATNSWKPTIAFTANTTHYWQVKPRNAAGASFGPAWAFTIYTKLPSAPATPSPATGTTTLKTEPTLLDWADTTGAASYDVYVDNVLLGNVTASQYSLTKVLTKNATHTWKVVAKNPLGSTSSATWSFKFTG